ncbi:unnamed protein product [Moneuplotes crassus]|uniref:Uncharacterized protein n=1 Tax=Euplotes crassus TaxID=5936 RepID=A0AAD1UBM3_EUPCR|nr:unnamed protein product [Moneuplotes crassus]
MALILRTIMTPLIQNNIYNSLEVLQYIIDNDDDININFANTTGSKNTDKGSLRDIMMRVKRTLEVGIFGFKHNLPKNIQEKTFESKPAKLENYLGKNTSLATHPDVVPYYEVVDKLLASIAQLQANIKKRDEQGKLDTKNLKRQIKYRDKNIETLENQLVQLQEKSTHPIQEEYNRIVNENEKLLKENTQSKYEIDQFKEDFKELNDEYHKVLLKLNNMQEDLQKKEDEAQILSNQKEDLEKKIHKQNDIFTDSLKDYNDTLILLKRSQESYKNLLKQYESIQEENRKLEVRAAAGFESLTPRYKDFKGAFKKLRIKKPELKKGYTTRTSIQYIERLISAYSELQENA